MHLLHQVQVHLLHQVQVHLLRQVQVAWQPWRPHRPVPRGSREPEALEASPRIPDVHQVQMHFLHQVQVHFLHQVQVHLLRQARVAYQKPLRSPPAGRLW